MKLQIRNIGNSQGIILPQSVLAQSGLHGEIEAKVKDNTIVLSKSRRIARKDWAEECKEIAEAGQDKLVWPEFSNEADAEWTW